MATTLSGRLVNQRQMAEIMGVSAEAIRNWLQQGCPNQAGDKGARVYLPSDVIKWRQDRALSRAMAEQDLSDLDEAKCRKTAAEAALAEIELAEKRGEVVELALIEGRLTAALTACRTRLLAVGARVAPVLVGTTGAAAMKSVVDDAISEALEEIANGMLGPDREPGRPDRADDPDGLGGDASTAKADDR